MWLCVFVSGNVLMFFAVLLSLWRLDIWQINLAKKAFLSFRVLPFSDILEALAAPTVLMQAARRLRCLLKNQDSYEE